YPIPSAIFFNVLISDEFFFKPLITNRFDRTTVTVFCDGLQLLGLYLIETEKAKT
ncbi:MAG: hypothetical protein RL394_21, partial [Bacteroidota bacterium]